MPLAAPFRFETLLRLRRRREDAAKQTVAAQVDSLRAALSQGRLAVDEVRWGRHWLARLRLGVLSTDAEIASHRAMLADERSRLATAQKETKVLEKLKERRFQELALAAARAEQREADEISLSRFARRMAEEGTP